MQVGPDDIVVADDDTYRRCLTWHYQKGDGKYFNIRWLKRRVMRFERGLVARALVEHRSQIQKSRAADLVQSEFAEPAEPELDAITDHLFLPEREELDKLLAYETLISRELEHAIAELERLQARRKRKNESGGENLPKQSPEGL